MLWKTHSFLQHFVLVGKLTQMFSSCLFLCHIQRTLRSQALLLLMFFEYCRNFFFGNATVEPYMNLSDRLLNFNHILSVSWVMRPLKMHLVILPSIKLQSFLILVWIINMIKAYAEPEDTGYCSIAEGCSVSEGFNNHTKARDDDSEYPYIQQFSFSQSWRCWLDF